MLNRAGLVFCAGLIFLYGCAIGSDRSMRPSGLAGIPASQLPVFRPPKTEEGSLWSDVRGISLYPDRRASRVGDIVTVRIVEDPEAKLNANTNTTRNSSLSAKLKFLGYMKALADKNPRLAQNPGTDDLINSTLGASFDGKGSSDRTGHVKAYITAMVVDVLPNGFLSITGRREIRVNNETEYITISGIIRPEDIGPNNEIASTYVANARIIYSGSGPLADKQKPGWLGRIIDHVWPF